MRDLLLRSSKDTARLPLSRHAEDHQPDSSKPTGSRGHCRRGHTHGQAPSVLPQVGTSSSADEVCSSVEGFFFPRPMILVIFFPVTLDTVPLASDLELFFLLTVKNNNENKKVCFDYRLQLRTFLKKPKSWSVLSSLISTH